MVRRLARNGRNLPVAVAFVVCFWTQTALGQDRTSGQTSPIEAVSSITPVSNVFADLFAPLPSDFGHLASKQNLVLAGVGGLGALAAHSFDARVASTPWSPDSAAVMQPGWLVGSDYVQSGGALATYALGRITRSPRVSRIGASLFRAQIVAQGTAQLLKISTNRTRPDGTSLSFPSGHSASMFAMATVIQSEVGWKAGIAAYATASWVAASRVEAHRHFLSDVVAGATVGILAGRAVTFGSGNARFAVGPAAVPGGIGISFSRIEKP